MTPLLEVLDVRRSYGTLQALDGVSFQVQPGELFGLLGPNGAGKSTLLGILSFLNESTSGEVRIDGRRIEPGNLEVRRDIGIVPQDLAIYDQLTAYENLAFFGELFGMGGASLHEARRGVARCRGSGDTRRRSRRHLLRRHETSAQPGRRWSMRRGYSLLDEPTVGVDPQSRNHIFEEVRRLNAGGLTIVYTSHYMEEVQALCTRIGIIDHGQLVACDTLPGLLQQLQGLVRCRLASVPAALRRRLTEIPGCSVHENSGGLIELHGSDVKGMLLRLVALLSEANVELIHLETEEPNLERVFLHLTGRARAIDRLATGRSATMKVVLALARKELRLLLRDRMAAGLLVGMPLLFILILGLLLGENFGQKADESLQIFIVNLDKGIGLRGRSWASWVIQDLGETRGIKIQTIPNIDTAEALIREHRRAAVLVLREDFSDRLNRCSFLDEPGNVNPFHREGVYLDPDDPKNTKHVDLGLKLLKDPMQLSASSIIEQVVQVCMLRIVLPYMIGQAFLKLSDDRFIARLGNEVRLPLPDDFPAIVNSGKSLLE